MKEFIYLLQVSMCTGLFYSFYFFLLRRLTFFTLNRWYLLLTLLLSFAIPKLSMPFSVPNAAVLKPVMYVQQIKEVQITSFSIANTVVYKPHISWVETTKAIYLTVALLLLFRLLFVLTIFCRKLRNKKLMQFGHIKVLQSNTKFGNSSFLNVVFINDKDLDANEVEQILAHELLHIKLLHSADRIIAWLAQIVLWFNPFVYAYLRSIEENHEFEVDRIAAGEDDKNRYASLLFKLSVSNQSYMYQAFSKAPLKKRVFMLFNKPTSNMKKVIYVLILPVVVISCLAFAKLRKNETAIINKVAAKVKSDKDISLGSDSIKKYRQKTWRTLKAVNRKKLKDYRQTADFKQKTAAMSKVMNKLLRFKVVSDFDSINIIGKVSGYKVSYDGYTYILRTDYGQEKHLKGALQVGDELEIKAFGGAYGNNFPVILTPAIVVKNGVKIFQLTEADLIPKEPFLYEANRVRFTDGQVTNIEKYSNGKWKSAVVEVVNGYKIKFNIKEDAPAFNDIEWGDHVRFRFIHEEKTGTKEYTVKDWVSLSTNIKSYGIKNPEYFYKFYEKI